MIILVVGVWTVGNIGREQGSLKWPLIAAYVAYPIRYYVYDETVWFTLVVLAAALAFDSLSKEWRRTPRRRHIIKYFYFLAYKYSLFFKSLYVLGIGMVQSPS